MTGVAIKNIAWNEKQTKTEDTYPLPAAISMPMLRHCSSSSNIKSWHRRTIEHLGKTDGRHIDIQENPRNIIYTIKSLNMYKRAILCYKKQHSHFTKVCE